MERDTCELKTLALAKESTLKRIISLGIILFCILYMGYSLYSEGLVGLSDNGDFNRVMKPNRIAYTHNGRTPFAFQRYYELTFIGNSRGEKLWNMLFTLDEPYHTTQNVFIKLSLLANTAYHAVTDGRYTQYDIFWLGLVYFIAYAGAIGVIIKNIKTSSPWLHAILGLLLIIIFCDAAYVAYFNSFYGEPLQMVTLMWIAASVTGVVSSNSKKAGYVLLFYVSVVFFSGAKYANIPQGMLLSICGLVFLRYYKTQAPLNALKNEALRNQSVNRFFILSCVVFSLLAHSLFYENVPRWMDKQTTYQSVFYGVLKGSETPKEDLLQLGLPQEYSDLANTNAYMSGYKVDIGSKEFSERFYERVTKFDVLSFYVKNPSRFIEKLEISCLNSAHIRPVYLANYDISHGRLKFREDMSLWSRFRLELPINRLWFGAALFILSGGWVAFQFVRFLKSRNREPGILVLILFFTALIAINAMNLVIPVVANGEADLAKHMFAYVMGLDLQILILSVWMVWFFVGRYKGFVKKVAFPAAVIALVLAAFILPGNARISSTVTEFEAETNVGDIVPFGSMNDQPLLWRVIQKEGTRLQLFALNPVTMSAYDATDGAGDEMRKRYGSNCWSDSMIRKWLNNDFLECFTAGELQMIRQHENRVILSITDRDKAESGDRDFFWTHIPSQVAFGSADAYTVRVLDKVFLPDVDEFSELIYKNDIEKHPSQAYWLETPYYNNSSMVRVVERDGYVYMKDASEDTIGVRPCLMVDVAGF